MNEIIKAKNTELYGIEELPDFRATRAAWFAAGYRIVGNPEAWVGNEAHAESGASVPASLIALGRGVAGDGDPALYWAVGEHQRRSEERSRTQALNQEAEAIGALAKALAEANDQSVLDRVLANLSERTQFAVKAQLKGTRFLPGTR